MFYNCKGSLKHQLTCTLFIRLRKEKDITQQQAATHLSVTQSNISKFENGHTDIEFFQALSLMELYNIEPEDFFIELQSLLLKEKKKAAVIDKILTSKMTGKRRS